MLIGKIQGKLVVLYESIQEAKDAKSCSMCSRYSETKPCRFYAICRAEKKPGQEPLLFDLANNTTIKNRTFTLEEKDKYGLKRFSYNG